MVTLRNTQARVYTFNLAGELNKTTGRREMRRFRAVPTIPLKVSDEDFSEISQLPFFKRLKKEGYITVEQTKSGPVPKEAPAPAPTEVVEEGDDVPTKTEIMKMTEEQLVALASDYGVELEEGTLTEKRNAMKDYIYDSE